MPLRLLGVFGPIFHFVGVPWGDIGNWFPQSSPRKLVSSAPGPRQLCCPPGGPGCQGQCCSRFRCLIGRAPHRTIVAMIYTESKYKHNSSPPPHDLRLPPLSPMSCTSLPRRAPPQSLMLHGRSRQSCARERRASHRFTAARKSGVRRARPNAQIRNQAKWRQARPPTLRSLTPF